MKTLFPRLRRPFAQALLCGFCLIAHAQTSGADLASLADLAPFARATALRARYQALPAENFAADLTALRALPHPFQEEARAVLIRAWAARDPADALAAALADSPGPHRAEALSALFRVWAAQNPQAAFAALKANVADPQKESLLAGYFEGHAQRDPAEAFALLIRQKTETPGLVSNETPLGVLIFREWARRDPQAALTALLKDDHDASECVLSSAFLPLWFRENPKGCWKAIGDIAKEDKRRHMRTHLFTEGTLSFDGADMLIAFFNAEKGDKNDWMSRLLFTALAKQDVPRALALAETLRNEGQRNAALASIYSEWAEDDFSAAMRGVNTLPDAKLRNKALKDIWKKRLAEGSLPQNLKELMSLTDAGLRKEILRESMDDYIENGGDLGALMRQLSSPREQRELLTMLATSRLSFETKDTKEAESLRQWAMLLPPGKARAQLLSSIFSENGQALDLAWMQENLKPGEFHAFAREMIYSQRETSLLTPENIAAFPDGPLRDRFIESLARKMREDSPEKAREWLFSLSPGKARDSAYSNYISEMIRKKQWEGAQAAMREAPEGYVLPDHTYASFASQMAKDDMAGALAWACAQSDAKARESALEGVAWASQSQTPEEFFAQMQGVVQMPESTRAIASFVSNWSNKDAAAAAKWLQTNTASAAAPEAVDAVMRNWVTENPMEATQWLATLPEGALRNNAIMGLATSGELQKSPDEVFAWIVTLPENVNEKTTREELVVGILMQLSVENREKADTLLSNPKLTEKERATVQKYLSQLPTN